MEQRNLTNNTIGKYISTLKTFLHWSTEMDYCKNSKFKKFKILEEKTDIIYLTNEKFEKLYKHDLSEVSQLDHVRDVFCFQCLTGHKDYKIMAKYLKLTTKVIKEEMIRAWSKQK